MFGLKESRSRLWSAATLLLLLSQFSCTFASAETPENNLSKGALTREEAVQETSMNETFSELDKKTENNTKTNLKGIISVYEGPTPDQLVGNLVNQAIQKDQNSALLDKKNKQMHGIVHKAISGAKISANFITEYRGFEMSSEGADVILDEKLRLKSKSATEYAQQKHNDELHAKVFASLLQLAQGLGYRDQHSREKAIAAGLKPLSDLVGEDEAKRTLAKLESWSRQLQVPESILSQDPWTVIELQQKSEQLLRESAQSDPVMGLVRRALHKYNRHSKLALGAAKVINTSLNIAMFSPTIVSPAAQILQFVYQMATGGPEDQKLLAELYLDRRMESRWKRLNQEATQAVNAYNNAIMSDNAVLLGLSESFIQALGGEECSSNIIGEHRRVARKSTHNDAIDCVQTHSQI